jgi:hypothetical protein
MQRSSSDPPHRVLDKPWTFEVSELSIDFVARRLVMKLSRGKELVVLVFSEIHQLTLDEGYTGTESGMEIVDCSSSGMENARVRVSSFEQDPAIHFWAKEVERVL